MKGLLAIIAKKESQQPLISTKLQHGLDALSHRGKYPFYILQSQNGENSNIGIGVTADNPDREKNIFTNDNIVLVFDGKILNKKYLKETYFEKNNINSDEELLANLYLKLGENAFSLWEGYGSIILIDKNLEKTYAICDTVGTRPLFYYQSEDFLVFSSEIKPIYKMFSSQITINQHAIIAYLLWGDIMKHRQDFYLNIFTLTPANFISYTWNEREMIQKQYYYLPYKSCMGKYDAYDEKIIVDKTKSLIFSNIKNHIADKKKIAVGLSGGLDSSSIICTIKAINPEMPLTAFTAVNEINQSETLWAEKIVRHTKAEWIKVNCNTITLIEDWERVIACQGIPIFNFSSLAQYRVMETVLQHGFNSIIDGQGGDELFGGYNYYYSLMCDELFAEWMFKEGVQFCSHLSNAADVSLKTIIRTLLKNFTKNNLLNEKHAAFFKRKTILACLDGNKMNAYFQREKTKRLIKENFNEYLYEDFTVYLSYLLRWGVHSAACFGIDCLTPFADNRPLAQHLFDTPSVYKLHKAWSKYILRAAMKNIVPEEILLRKQKLGFYTPDEQWLDQIADEMKSYIYEMPDKENIIDKKHLLSIWDEQFAIGNTHFKQFAFRCMSYLIWQNSLLW